MQRYMSSFEQNGGGVKLIPDLKAKVWILDSTMSMAVGCFIVQGIFVTKLADIQFEYAQASTQVKEVAATFAMQYFYHTDLDGNTIDPLQV